jgi:hypothetical protein
MSKNMKIVAIVGAVLIVGFIIMSAVTKGGCGGAMDVWGGMLGCQSEAEKGKGASSRDFCVQNPDDPRCKQTEGEGEEPPLEEEEAPARPAAPAEDD